MKNNSRIIHEKYHINTNVSKKIIKEKNFTYRLLLNVINKNISVEMQKSILDIGCGAGSISFYLAKKGHNVTGIDISKKAIRECIKSATDLNLKIDFKVSDFPKTFFMKKKFDEVIFTEVIEHLENDNLALKKIHSLLKSNGKLILSTPSLSAPLQRLNLTKKFDEKVGHLRRYKLNDLKRKLKLNGFRITEIHKTEGILRNFLFINPYAGKLVRFLNRFEILSNTVTFMDNISLMVFGESNFIIIARSMPGNKK